MSTISRKCLLLMVTMVFTGCSTGDTVEDIPRPAYGTPLVNPLPFDEPIVYYRLQVENFNISVGDSPEISQNCVTITPIEGSPIVSVLGNATWNSDLTKVKLIVQAEEREVSQEGASPVQVETGPMMEGTSKPVVIVATGSDSTTAHLINLEIFAAYDGKEAPKMGLKTLA